MKYVLTHAPVLALPTFGEPFGVICEASIVDIGAFHLQKRRPIPFESRKFSLAENNFTTRDQELTMVVHELRNWRCYLEGADSVVVTDHNPLTYLKSQQILSRRHARWFEYSEQNFTSRLEYRPRCINIADPLIGNPLGGNAFEPWLFGM